MGVAILLLLIISIDSWCLAAPRSSDASLELEILHMNDFHARFEETNEGGGVCKNDDDCIGGLSRMTQTIFNSLDKHPTSILLNGGDNFQGTLYYSLFKWNITQYFLNQLPFDAIVLGNHEFDDGIAGVVPYLKAIKSPVVVSNIDDSLEPTIQGLYKKSTIIVRDGRKIGIIGVIIKTTNEISSTENLKFLDESDSVNAEAERLVNEEGVFTNIVLSHSGYDVDQRMAAKATKQSKISVIVGGHSHSFLYSGDPVPGPDIVKGPYPTVVQNDAGEDILVVQASAYCKYLGNLTVSYDEDGNLLRWQGEPIFLDTMLPQNEHFNEELAPWKEGVDSLGNKILGSTSVTLDQSSCYISECLLGNFVTDVMVYSYIDQADESSWTYSSLAVFNPGGLRTNINIGNITYSDMITAQPFGNTFDVGEIQGKYIKEMFEYCTSSSYYYGRSFANIRLLQVSGFHVVFDLSQPIGSRVTSIQVRCNECKIPIYEDLDLNHTYRLIVPSFLKTGGDGFVVITENLKNIKVGRLDMDVFTDYLAKRSPVFEEIEGRISVLNGGNLMARDLHT